MSHYVDFRNECSSNIKTQSSNESFVSNTKSWMTLASEFKYSYNFEYLGRPIIQYPQDIVQFQEIIYKTKPTLIVETGIAHGGSLVLSASLLCLLDVMEGIDPRNSDRKVVGVDIDIREHNLKALDNHPLRFKMELIQGSSIDPDIISQVHRHAEGHKKVVVALDSNHSHSHVLGELNAYADLVNVGSYCIVYDTNVEDLPPNTFPDRPWGVGNNPKTAVQEWLKSNSGFAIDKDIDNKLLISVAPDGFLIRTN